MKRKREDEEEVVEDNMIESKTVECSVLACRHMRHKGGELVAKRKRLEMKYALTMTPSAEGKLVISGEALSSIYQQCIHEIKVMERSLDTAVYHLPLPVAFLQEQFASLSTILLVKSTGPTPRYVKSTAVFEMPFHIDWQTFYDITINKKCILSIVRGNFTEPVNNRRYSYLVHLTNSALDGDLAQFAGQGMVRECEEIIKTAGLLMPSQVELTSAGKLAPYYDGIIHAVCSAYVPSLEQCNKSMESTISNVLKKAVESKLQFVSIVIPISDPKPGQFPIDQISRCIINTAGRFLSENPKAPITEIILIHREEEGAACLTSVVRDVLHNQTESAPSADRASGYQWYWGHESQTWAPYDHEQNLQLEAAHQSDLNSRFVLGGEFSHAHNSQQYEICFKTMTQTNIFTNRTRSIRREVIQSRESEPTRHSPLVHVTAQEYIKSYPSEWIDSDRKSLPKPLQEALLVIKETKNRMSGVVEAITKFHDKYRVQEKQIPIDPSQADLLYLTHFCAPYKVSIRLLNSRLLVTGTKESIQHLQDKLMDSSRFVSVPDANHYPSEWKEQKENIHLEELDCDSDEYQRVEKRVTETLSHVKVTNIVRVQNKSLWEQYNIQKTFLQKKLKRSDLIERELFHGTGTTDPTLLYSSEKSFDPRFCQRGLWGTGAYFACRADYSYNYSHILGKTTEQVVRQFFLARVLVGHSVHVTKDAKSQLLKMPPVKPSFSSFSSSSSSSSSSSGSTIQQQERYDSVTGMTHGAINGVESQVFVIYETDRAYPSYLITFSVPTVFETPLPRPPPPSTRTIAPPKYRWTMPSSAAVGMTSSHGQVQPHAPVPVSTPLALEQRHQDSPSRIYKSNSSASSMMAPWTYQAETVE